MRKKVEYQKYNEISRKKLLFQMIFNYLEKMQKFLMFIVKHGKCFLRYMDFITATHRANLSTIIMNTGKTDGQDQ